MTSLKPPVRKKNDISVNKGINGILLISTIIVLMQNFASYCAEAASSPYYLQHEVLLPPNSKNIRKHLDLPSVSYNDHLDDANNDFGSNKILLNLEKDGEVYDATAKVRIYRTPGYGPQNEAPTQNQWNAGSKIKRQATSDETGATPTVYRLDELGVQPVYGHVEGNKDTQVFGTVFNGNFAGHIHAANETYYIRTRKISQQPHHHRPESAPLFGARDDNVADDDHLRQARPARQYAEADVIERQSDVTHNEQLKERLSHMDLCVAKPHVIDSSVHVSYSGLDQANSAENELELPSQNAAVYNMRRRRRSSSNNVDERYLPLVLRHRGAAALAGGSAAQHITDIANMMFSNNENDIKSPQYAETSLKEPVINWHQYAKRTGRRLGKNKVCRMLLIADHTYFQWHAKFDLQVVISDMTWLVKEASRIYGANDFDFDGEPDGLSFSIGEIIVFEDPFVPNYPLFKRTYPQNLDGANQYLEDLSEFKVEGFCVAYGFSMASFHDAIGMSWVGEICNPRWSFGFLTLNYTGKQAPKPMMIATVVHEMGHLFGAFHDPNVEQVHPCSPGSYGDNYIMYPKAQLVDYSTRNVQFSPCSKNVIYESLIIKNNSKCFIDGSEHADQYSNRASAVQLRSSSAELQQRMLSVEVLSCAKYDNGEDAGGDPIQRKKKYSAQCDPRDADNGGCCYGNCTMAKHFMACRSGLLHWGKCFAGKCRSSFLGLQTASMLGEHGAPESLPSTGGTENSSNKTPASSAADSLFSTVCRTQTNAITCLLVIMAMSLVSSSTCWWWFEPGSSGRFIILYEQKS